MGIQKVSPISGWDNAAPHLEAWAVLCTVFLGGKKKHLETFNMF